MRILTQHTSAHEAVLIIQRLFAKAGCVSEIVTNDFGEDLHIQPNERGEVDPFLIAVQVKSINYRTKRAKKYVQVRVDHLRRWHDSLLPTLICAHDYSTGKSHVTFANRFSSRWEYTHTTEKYKNIYLHEFEELTDDNAEIQIWKCRFRYYERTMNILLGELQDWRVLSDHVKNRDFGKEPADIHIFSTQILFTLGVIRTDGQEAAFSGAFLDIFESRSKHHREECGDICEILILSVLEFVSRHQRTGLPYTVLWWLTHAAGFWMRALHQPLWDEHQTAFGRQWIPYAEL